MGTSTLVVLQVRWGGKHWLKIGRDAKGSDLIRVEIKPIVSFCVKFLLFKICGV